MELTVAMVKEWLAANKAEAGVKALLTELGRPELTAEVVTPWLETEDGKRVMQPYVDKRVTEAVKTHDTKTKDAADAEVKRRVEEAIAKALPKETPEQKELREFKTEFAKEKAARERAEVMGTLSEAARKMGVDMSLFEGHLPPTLELGITILERVKKHDAEIETKAKNELLAGGHKPGSGVNGAGGKTDLSKLSLEEAVKLEMEGKLDESIRPA